MQIIKVYQKNRRASHARAQKLVYKFTNSPYKMLTTLSVIVRSITLA